MKTLDAEDRTLARRSAAGRAQATANRSAVVAEQQAAYFDLRKTGLSIRAIADQVGLPKSTVQERIDAAIAELVHPKAEEQRQLDLERVDAWLTKLNAQIEAGRAVARNVEVARGLLDRRARMLGYDAPERVEATVTEVTQEDVALAELVAEARAAAAVAEAQIRAQHP